MIFLDATNRSLEIDLAGAVNSTQLPFVASYVDVETALFGVSGMASNTGASNDTTAVTMVAAPASSTSRQIKFLSIRNADDAAATVTVQFNDNATLRAIGVWTLAIGETLTYVDGEGFNVLTASGALKQSGGVDGPGSSTDHAIARWDGTGGGQLLDSGPTINDAGAITATAVAVTTLDASGLISADGGQIAFPATAVPSADVNTLDDYEEGTFTPTLTAATPGDLSVAYTVQLGRYTKIGNVVNYIARINTSTFTHTTASGALQIAGLPFTVSVATAIIVANSVSMGPFTRANVAGITAQPNTTLLNFNVSFDNAAAIAALAITDFASASNVVIYAGGVYNV